MGLDQVRQIRIGAGGATDFLFIRPLIGTDPVVGATYDQIEVYYHAQNKAGQWANPAITEWEETKPHATSYSHYKLVVPAAVKFGTPAPVGECLYDVFVRYPMYGDSTTEWEITLPGAPGTVRYTWTGVGSDPNITVDTMSIGEPIVIDCVAAPGDPPGSGFSAGNNGEFMVTDFSSVSGAVYFEISNSGAPVPETALEGSFGEGIFWRYRVDYGSFIMVSDTDADLIGSAVATITAAIPTAAENADAVLDEKLWAHCSHPAALADWTLSDFVYFNYARVSHFSTNETTGAITVRNHLVAQIMTIQLLNGSDLPIGSGEDVLGAIPMVYGP